MTKGKILDSSFKGSEQGADRLKGDDLSNLLRNERHAPATKL